MFMVWVASAGGARPVSGTACPACPSARHHSDSSKIMQLAGPHPWLFAIEPVVRSVLRASKWSACRLAIARGLAESHFYGRGVVIVLPHIDHGLRRIRPAG